MNISYYVCAYALQNTCCSGYGYEHHLARCARARFLCRYISVSLSLAHNLACNTVAYRARKKEENYTNKNTCAARHTGVFMPVYGFVLGQRALRGCSIPAQYQIFARTHTIQETRERRRRRMRDVFDVVYFITCSAYMRERILLCVAAPLQRDGCFRCRYSSGVTTHVVVRSEVWGTNKTPCLIHYFQFITHATEQNTCNSRALQPSHNRHPGPGERKT